ncbi:COX15/CtaA family protein [Caldithrix abyssi]|uniref:Cytochrome c oxidase assembly protein subunit 15 n=1 Tax=Caldithrix abyssi DSM 13497 TaxID=880073 RepID=H1XPM5_CALAY|nr:COX15/CtaA family protein [Caldithrix abyssi]APF19850.1 cytochrome c oxidase assembly protein subunit 15 [Caldithrix abyssi DSM 13497]EHO39946.1 cytochrome oxidase assembly [Caldithrix abyssi DSM 13497]
MKKFKSFALFTTAATYLLIFIGGLVRVSGAGLGCPDWPKCFGRWIPPTDISQLPPDMDPNLFNFTLAWIEYINRLAGMTVGLLIAVLAVWAIVKFRDQKNILIPAVLSALLVAFQGWQGSKVVSSGLEPFVITIHMALAFIIVSLVLYVYLQSHLRLKNNQLLLVRQNIKRAVLGLYLISIVQIIIGTQIRSQIEHIQKATPLLETGAVLDLVGFTTPLHVALALGMIVSAIYLRTYFKSTERSIPAHIENLVNAAIILFVLQALVGMVLIWIDLPALGRVIHLWISSMIIGVLLTLFVFLKTKGKNV